MKACCCHYCGQPLPDHRLGVSLPPGQGRVFDLICRAGDDGINRRDLADIIGCSKSTIATQVYYINEKLRDRGYHIRGYGTYRLIQWGKMANTAQPTKADLSFVPVRKDGSHGPGARMPRGRQGGARSLDTNGKQTIPGAVVP